jgi:acetyl esterase/lipase
LKRTEKTSRWNLFAPITIAVAMMSSPAFAGNESAASWTAHLSGEYGITPNVVYQTADGVDLKLDIYAPRGLTTPNKVLIYYHGGGWAGGGREYTVLRLMPWLEMGFTVVNVTYRGSRMSPAPAAVEDCRCALLWVVSNAARYQFDPERIVLTGDSAGSHLALMSGLLTPAAGFDRACAHLSSRDSRAGAAGPRVAAIVNWYGATDLADLLEGPNAQPFTIAWLGSRPDRDALAVRLSPLTHARPGAPPVLTIHGDADRVVPVGHASRLHAELSKHGVANRLITVPGGGHGDFTREQNEKNYAAIREFVSKQLPRGETASSRP